MKSKSFDYFNPFSSIDLRARAAADVWLEWADEHFEQGFGLMGPVVSFATLTDNNYQVVLEASDSRALPVSAVFAVAVPADLAPGGIAVRGGYSDSDHETVEHFRSVLFCECEGEVLVIRLSKERLESPKLLLAHEAYPHQAEFSTTAQPMSAPLDD